jgi:Sec-independent protein translocase protein TatA
MGFGTELMFVVALGSLLLGPKQLHALLKKFARAKAQFDQASRALRSQLDAELDAVAKAAKSEKTSETL